MAKTKPTECRSCPFNKYGTGFVPDRAQGPWENIRMALLLEDPNSGDILHEDPSDGYGAPLVGKTGQFFDYSILYALGIPRSSLLICSTIRCRPKMNVYPTGKFRVGAEEACRQWDGDLIRFDPNWIIHTYHPKDIFKKPQLVEYVKEAMKKAWSMRKEFRPLVTMGAKPMNLTEPWLRGGLKKWQRSYGEWSYEKFKI